MYPSIKNQRSPIFFFMIGILSISFCAQEKMYHLPDIEEYQLKNEPQQQSCLMKRLMQILKKNILVLE